MATFSDLPLDLLPYIMQHLSHKEFTSLVRVCKSIHDEVLPYLYEYITFQATASMDCARRLECLVRSLIERPRLAIHTKAFRLLGSHPCWNKDPSFYEADNPWAPNMWGLESCKSLPQLHVQKALELFDELIGEEASSADFRGRGLRVGEGLGGGWPGHEQGRFSKTLTSGRRGPPPQFRGRTKDALAVVALTQLKNLKTLEIGDGFLMYSLFLPRIVKKLREMFPKLVHIVLGNKEHDPDNSTVTYVDLELIRPVFYLSGIQSFEFTMSQPWSFHWNRMETPQAHDLKKLFLFRTTINRHTLGQILSATPCLKVLHYQQQLNPKKWKGNAQAFADLPTLDRALAPVAAGLEELHLTLEREPGVPANDDSIRFANMPPVQGTLTILKSMSRLRILEVPMIQLLGWPAGDRIPLEALIPTTIEKLTLRSDLAGFCPWNETMFLRETMIMIEDYLDSHGINAPKLQTFHFRCWDEGPYDRKTIDAVRNMGLTSYGVSVRRRITFEKDDVEVHTWNFALPTLDE